LARAAVDFVYPPACRLCQVELGETADVLATGAFCDACRAGLVETRGRACRRCGATIGPNLDPNIPCGYCHDESFAFERVIRLGVYDGSLRAACLRAKEPGAEPLAAALAELTWNVQAEALRAAAPDVVVAVPAYRWQRLWRPYHAAETLAEVWARRLQVPLVSHILRKCRWTRPQAQLAPSERRKNLRRAFVAAGGRPLADATVLLADDVMTTGTTAHETARALRQAGAHKVIVAVIARGLGRR
jgi:predicted amidophosphoribosyltransferase